jgi:DNA (cytosine-5)-methyltransferase 1
MKYIDLFSGLGAFSHALDLLGHECVAALDIDQTLVNTYKQNFPSHSNVICADIRTSHHELPQHDILCAGFPCQPFSKSGKQEGLLDVERGDLVDSVIKIAAQNLPEYIFLENVANLSEHNSGITWLHIKESLEGLGYEVRWTKHVKKGGSGMLNPLDFGFPQNRERFFSVCRRGFLPADTFPAKQSTKSKIEEKIIADDLLSEDEILNSSITDKEYSCIENWQIAVNALPNKADDLPPFPIWLEEIDAEYPISFTTPFAELLKEGMSSHDIESRLAKLPPYAQSKQAIFPRWKRRFLQQNREWFDTFRHKIPQNAVDALRDLPHTYRKFEWNDKGGPANLWDHCLQFRPSGLRVSNSSYIPAIVSINKQQLPIYGPIRRRLVFREIKRCFGFPDSFILPPQSTASVSALGNTIHTSMLKILLEHVLLIPNLQITRSPNSGFSSRRSIVNG